MRKGKLLDCMVLIRVLMLLCCEKCGHNILQLRGSLIIIIMPGMIHNIWLIRRFKNIGNFKK